MSLDTHTLSKGFSSSPGCKRFTFALGKPQLSLYTCPEMEFAQNHSREFLHVVIQYPLDCEEESLIKSWCRYFTVFLQILTRDSQLISIVFHDLSTCFENIEPATYAQIGRAIFDFLESQHRLEQVEFDVCFFGFQEGVELLKKLRENNGKTLTSLILNKFTRYEPMDKEQNSTAAQNLLSIVDFLSLETLETDYSLIFENMIKPPSTDIQTVLNCQHLALSELTLHYKTGITPVEYFRGLTSSDWGFLKTLCPDLQMLLCVFTDSSSCREVEFLIAPNMPVGRLEYFSGDSDMEMEMEGSALFDHLLACNINDHLVDLYFDSDRPIRDLASAFPPFLRACRKLEGLRLSVVYPARGIDFLMRSLRRNPPESLLEVLIEIANAGDEGEFANLMHLAKLLRRKGLYTRVKLY